VYPLSPLFVNLDWGAPPQKEMCYIHPCSRSNAPLPSFSPTHITIAYTNINHGGFCQQRSSCRVRSTSVQAGRDTKKEPSNIQVLVVPSRFEIGKPGKATTDTSSVSRFLGGGEIPEPLAPPPMCHVISHRLPFSPVFPPLPYLKTPITFLV
jgi:hypothetical protein